jgi:hypothetical protein
MKVSLFFLLISLSSFSWADHDWKVVAESTNNCQEKFQVLAKEGEKFVYVSSGELKTKLFSQDGSAFSEQAGKALVFSNVSEKSQNQVGKQFSFTQPSVVDGNPPQLEMTMNQIQEKCRMKLK